VTGVLFVICHTVLVYITQEFGGMMTMSDVYCRVNRARGMEVSLYL